MGKSCDTPLLLKNLKLKNTNRLILGHFNINSVVGKSDHLKVLIVNNIDILVLTETKIDSSFPLILNLELLDFQHLLDSTKIDLVVEFLFMLEKTYLVKNQRSTFFQTT